jgi:hypothetical protein
MTQLMQGNGRIRRNAITPQRRESKKQRTRHRRLIRISNVESLDENLFLLLTIDYLNFSSVLSVLSLMERKVQMC